ncbi:MAG: sulfite exporter TauE/SafE family protein [Clostridia bacterium]|nr:sulfite exporter TauE/SafE family protein [Clostridia bacterium]
MDWLWFILAGAAGGVLGGMGMGGGTVLIPLLNIGFGLSQHLAQAINLISFVPMAVAALVIHFKNGLVETSGLVIIILAGLISCAVGCFIAREINAEVLRRIFGGFLTILSIVQAIGILRKKGKKPRR